ncbi:MULTISPECIES: hypothetical protein [unclassified Streptosporangium]|nr:MULTISPECIES: hypothetical protein [unclassified Streptosporangium]
MAEFMAERARVREIDDDRETSREETPADGEAGRFRLNIDDGFT